MSRCDILYKTLWRVKVAFYKSKQFTNGERWLDYRDSLRMSFVFYIFWHRFPLIARFSIYLSLYILTYLFCLPGHIYLSLYVFSAIYFCLPTHIYLLEAIFLNIATCRLFALLLILFKYCNVPAIYLYYLSII